LRGTLAYVAASRQRLSKLTHRRAHFSRAVNGREMATRKQYEPRSEKVGEWPCNALYTQVPVVTTPKYQGGHSARPQRLPDLRCLIWIEVPGCLNQPQTSRFSLVDLEHFDA
jgi:hypothetical protein